MDKILVFIICSSFPLHDTVRHLSKRADILPPSRPWELEASQGTHDRTARDPVPLPLRSAGPCHGGEPPSPAFASRSSAREKNEIPFTALLAPPGISGALAGLKFPLRSVTRVGTNLGASTIRLQSTSLLGSLRAAPAQSRVAEGLLGPHLSCLRCGDFASPVLDEVLELIAEDFDRADDGPRRGVAEGAERPAVNL